MSPRPGPVARATPAALATAGLVLLGLAAHQHRPPGRPTAVAAGTGSLPAAVARTGVAAAQPPSPQAARVASARPPAVGSVRPARPLPASVPVRLQIPVLGVSAPVVGLGLDADRSLQVPADPTRAGWYRASPAPGSLGPAIVVGHVDSAATGPAIFYRLATLRPGNLITIGRADGRTAVFTVTGVREFAKDHFPTQLVYTDTNDAALRLITCGGSFDAARGRYRDNVVVFATLTGTQAT